MCNYFDKILELRSQMWPSKTTWSQIWPSKTI